MALAYEDDQKAVPMILSDSWSMIQAAETAWKKGGAHEGERKARAMLLETLNWSKLIPPPARWLPELSAVCSDLAFKCACAAGPNDAVP